MTQTLTLLALVLVAVTVLFFLTPFGSERFWWIASAFALLVLGHLTYLASAPSSFDIRGRRR